jgi:hypothetical protein
MKFEDIAFEYEQKFGEQPPILTTLDVENKLYLRMLKEAIENNEPLTRNDLGKIFMDDKTAFY